MATSAEFWASGFSPGETNGSYEFLNGRGPNRYHLMRIMRKKGMKEFSEILSTLLTDSSPSTTASVTISQLTASANTAANVQGGVRTVATVELLGSSLNSDKDDTSANTARAVAAGDVTAMQEEIVMGDAAGGHGDRILTAPSNGSGVISYPSDASGNGGGGKQDNPT
jgi:hypothetical protein